ncbi:hypothetical protein Trydic_g20524 [Trypoxylus dichotomus]
MFSLRGERHYLAGEDLDGIWWHDDVGAAVGLMAGCGSGAIQSEPINKRTGQSGYEQVTPVVLVFVDLGAANA